jgi:hypothetical protein
LKVIVWLPGLTVIVQVAVTVSHAQRPEESSTSPVKLNGPEVVGVPVIAPVLEFKASPPGRFPVFENV